MSDISGLRRCSRCKCTMLLKYFSENRKGELFKTCDTCLEKNRKYAENHKEERKENTERWVMNNKEHFKEQKKIYYKANKEKINRKKNEWDKNKRDTDVNYRVLKNLRNRLWYAIKENTKSATTKILLGCTSEELKIHLENKFTDGMNWDNYGKWHIDHILPCCSFDMSSSDKQKECFHFSNLQPLWAIDNMIKGGRILLEEGDILDEVPIMPDI
jgi:aspartyl-tRNA synthetase